MIFILSGCIFSGSRKSEFTREELEEYAREKYAIGDATYIYDFYGDNYYTDTHVETSDYHYYNYKEKNERGLEFSVVDIRRYDVKISNGYYVTKTNFNQKVILDYVDNHELDYDFYLSNSEGGYSSSMSDCFGKPYKIVIPYSNDFDVKLDSIVKYVKDMNDYNKKVTGSSNNLYVYLLFKDVDNNKSLDVRITDKEEKGNSECSYKNAKKCIVGMKKDLID